ncbi:hypothetical protein D3C77_311660 [compost metagenome]
MAQQVRQLLHDGQAQARARLVHRGAGQAHELAEDRLTVRLGDAAPGVADQNPHPLAVAPGPDQHPAPVGVADGVGDQVLQHGAQQVAVRGDPQAGRRRRQRQPLGAGDRGELARQFVEQAAQGQRRHGGPDAARLQLGQVQQGGQQAVGAVDGAVGVDGQAARA